jgi:exosortase
MRPAFAYPGLALLFAFAFRPMGGDGFVRLPTSSQIEVWFFDTRGSSAGLVACVAAWMAWRRLPELGRGLARTPRSLPIALAALFVFVYVWARLNEAGDLLFVALALLLASFSALKAGPRGLRVMAVPIAALLFALPIPSPLNNEILWTLQNWSASGTARLLELFGIEIWRSGSYLTHGEIHFLVIEGCSGLRSILTLTLLSLVIRDLVDARHRSGWLLVVIAPPLALALNVLRISVIVLGSTQVEQAAEDTHLGQGLAVLAVGSIILFVIGHYLGSAPAPEGRAPSPHRGVEVLPLGRAALLLALLGGASLAIAPFALPIRSEAKQIDLPMEAGDWEGEEAVVDYPYIGMLPRGHIEQRHYWQGRAEEPGSRSNPIEVLIATDSGKRPRGSPVTTKLIAPARGWQVEQTTRTHSWMLGRDIQVSRLSAGTRRRLVYSWSLHDKGFWRDSWRSLLALERGPFERARTRLMIHLSTEIGEGKDAERNAKVHLDGFLYDLNVPLRAL